MKKAGLGGFEEMVLLTAAVLGADAYGATIKKELEKSMKKNVSLGALYSALQRLEDKGWVNSRIGGITEERGGRRKQFYDITNEGVIALEEVRSLRNEMFNRIPSNKLNALKS